MIVMGAEALGVGEFDERHTRALRSARGCAGHVHHRGVLVRGHLGDERALGFPQILDLPTGDEPAQRGGDQRRD